MISSIDFNDFTFDSSGATTQSFTGIGMVPIRATSEPLSQENGAIATSYKYDKRSFGWSGDLVSDSYANYRILRNALMLGLVPVRFQGDDMVFTLLDGDEWTLRDVRLVSHDLDLPSEEPSVSWNSYSLTFEAMYPFFEADVHDNTQDRTIISGGTGIPTPVAMALASGSSSGSDPLTVNNAGNAPATPIFTITGPGTTFTITNSTNGQQMVIDTTLSTTQTIIIDVRGKTIKVDGTSILSQASGEWIVLSPGDNTISLTVDADYDTNTQMETVFYDTYLGI